LLKAASSLAVNTAREEGASTASLGNLRQGLSTLIGKKFKSSFVLKELQKRASRLIGE